MALFDKLEKPTESPKMFGAKVVSCSASIGWGGQGGSCNLTLVEDPRDGSLLDLPAIGSACFFKYYNFYFGGIFQRWTYKESSSGRLYDIVLESPSKLLDGIQVILDEFQGTVYKEATQFRPYTGIIFDNQIDNVWNPFAELENYPAIPDHAHFGKANVNSAGFPVGENAAYRWDWVLLSYISWIGNGRGRFGGKAHFGESYYGIDVSELQAALEGTDGANNYRLSGSVQNLNGIFSDIAEAIQVDWFVDITSGTVDGLFPLANAPNTRDTGISCDDPDLEPGAACSPGEDFKGGGLLADPIFKIRICDKREQPKLGVVSSYVDEAKTTGRLVSSNIGQEMKDAATQKVLIGGPATRWYEAPVAMDITALSVWGTLGNNAAHILGTQPAVIEYANTNTHIPVLLGDTGGGGQYNAKLFELRMALGGMKTWETYKVFQTIAGVEPNGYTPADMPWIGGVEPSKWVLGLFSGNGGRYGDNVDLAVTSINLSTEAYKDARKELSKDIYAAVNKVASNFYGQVFLVPLPYEPGGIINNLRWISEDVQYEASWEIAESAWTSIKHIKDWNFYDGDGKLKSAAVWPISNSIDYSPLGGDYATRFGPLANGGDTRCLVGHGTPSILTACGGVVNGLASSKGGPDKDIFWVPAFSLSGSEFRDVPYVIVRTGSQLRFYDGVTTPDFGLTVLAKMFFDVDIPPQHYILPGKGSAQIAIPPAAAMPTTMGVPQVSKRYTWGPWYAFSAKNGKAEAQIDSSMVPETFGSTAVMDLAANATIVSGLATVDPSESGSVQLAEFPAFSMGERFVGIGPYITDISIAIGIQGCTTTYKFNTWTPNFGKLAKYNIDRISRINKATIAFMQKQRGKFNKRPFPKIPFKPTNFEAEANFGWKFGNGAEAMQGFGGWLGGLRRGGAGVRQPRPEQDRGEI